MAEFKKIYSNYNGQTPSTGKEVEDAFNENFDQIAQLERQVNPFINLDASYFRYNHLLTLNSAIKNVVLSNFEGYPIIRRSEFNPAKTHLVFSIAVLDKINDYFNPANEKLLAQVSYQFNADGVERIKLNPYANNGITGYVDIDIRVLLNVDLAAIVADERSNYFNSGIIKERIDLIPDLNRFMNFINSTPGSFNAGRFIDRFIKELYIEVPEWKDGYIVISNMYYDAAGDFILLLSKAPSTDTILSSAAPYLFSYTKVLKASLKGIQEIIIYDYATKEQRYGRMIVDFDMLPPNLPSIITTSANSFKSLGIRLDNAVDVNNYNITVPILSKIGIVYGKQYSRQVITLNNILKRIELNKPLDGFLVITEFITFNTDYFRIRFSKTLSESEKVASTNMKYVLEGVIAKGIGQQKISLTPINASGFSGYITFDLTGADITESSPFDYPSFNDRGISAENIIYSSDVTKFIPEYASIHKAFQAQATGRIKVGEQLLDCVKSVPTSPSDYIPIEVNKSAMLYRDTEDVTFSKGGNFLLLKDYKDGYYYFQSLYEILRTDSLEKNVSEWEVLLNKTDKAPISDINLVRGITIIDNELFIQIETTEAKHYAYLFLNLSSLTYKEFTIEGQTGIAFITPENGGLNMGGGISAYGNMRFMAMYDLGNSGATDGTGRGNAQQAYISHDFGTNWTKIFDFDYDGIDASWNNANKQRESFHLHGITYDPYWKRIWLCTGDGAYFGDNTALFWSDDLGVTWKWRRLITEDNNIIQSMHVYPFKDLLIIDSDATQTGMVVINRNDRENFTVEKGKIFPPTGLYAFGRNKTVHNGIVYTGFGKDTAATTAGSFIVSTNNGREYTQIYRDETPDFSESDGWLWLCNDGKFLYASLGMNKPVRKWRL